MKTIFSDKAAIVIRAMLSHPKRKWVASDFEKELNVGALKSRRSIIYITQEGVCGKSPFWKIGP